MVTFTHGGGGTPAHAWREHPSWPDLAPFDLAALDVDLVVVLAAHPDDESLGAGGLVATAHDLGLGVRVVVATSGEGSHPRSPSHTRDELAVVRRGEAAAAADLLAPGTAPDLLELPDGAVAAHDDRLVRQLVALLGDGRRTLLVAPWRHDGHPDHEAAGRAAATAAGRTGARLVEYPVWWWHWSDPADARWDRLRSLLLTEAAAGRKIAAIAAHRSQVARLSPEPGDEVLLGPELLAHFAGDREVYVEQPATDTALDDLHQAAEDPWGVDHRWYEQRKRDLLLAALPRRRFRRAVEVGCSIGALSADLAGRCDELVALDASARAVALARTRLAGLAHVRVEQAEVPRTWPDGEWDLVVISEVGYFLSPVALDLLAERIRGSLREDGVVVLCHWRHPVAGWVLDGADVHARFLAAAGLPPLAAEYRDRDVELLVLAAPQVLPDPHA